MIDAAAIAARFGECPDCNADSSFRQVEPGIFALIVQHDPTCPAYAAAVKRRSA